LNSFRELFDISLIVSYKFLGYLADIPLARTSLHRHPIIPTDETSTLAIGASLDRAIITSRIASNLRILISPYLVRTMSLGIPSCACIHRKLLKLLTAFSLDRLQSACGQDHHLYSFEVHSVNMAEDFLIAVEPCQRSRSKKRTRAQVSHSMRQHQRLRVRRWSYSQKSVRWTRNGPWSYRDPW
jgi:hypothetical protein